MATFTTYGPQVVGGFTRYGTQTVVDFGGGGVVAPVLPTTLSLTGYVGQSYQRTLTASGDPATSWTITGGADAASYTLSNAGLLQRIAPNDTEEVETITVTATNAAGTSGVMTIYVRYDIQNIDGVRRKRQKRITRNFFFYGGKWNK